MIRLLQAMIKKLLSGKVIWVIFFLFYSFLALGQNKLLKHVESEFLKNGIHTMENGYVYMIYSLDCITCIEKIMDDYFSSDGMDKKVAFVLRG